MSDTSKIHDDQDHTDTRENELDFQELTYRVTTLVNAAENLNGIGEHKLANLLIKQAKVFLKQAVSQ